MFREGLEEDRTSPTVERCRDRCVVRIEGDPLAGVGAQEVRPPGPGGRMPTGPGFASTARSPEENANDGNRSGTRDLEGESILWKSLPTAQ